MFQKISMDDGWRFLLGEVREDVKRDHAYAYSATRAGGLRGAAGFALDDSDWARVSLPHDFAAVQALDRSAIVSQGYRPRGIAWYRKHFPLPVEYLDKRLFLRFDGVATYAEVYLNGMPLTVNRDGYTGFVAEITEMCFFDERENLLSVRVDAEAFEGWWYEGAGIYRHVWLELRDAVAIDPDSVWIKPYPVGSGMKDGFLKSREVPGADWRIDASATVVNRGEPVNAHVVLRLTDTGGAVRAQGEVEALLQRGSSPIALSADIASPALWDVDDPRLYQAELSIALPDGAADAQRRDIGFRTIAFDPETGFYLNGRPLKIKGVCCHQDHAGVGVAVADSILDFRIRRLKQMGANAYRCAHNNPSPEFLELCDRHGLMVLNENRHFSSSPLVLEQIRRMARSSRNHPSVFMYSLCNEEPWQSLRIGHRMARRMAEALRELDPNRPISGAQNDGVMSEWSIGNVVDVCGFNYQIDRFDAFHAQNPKKPIIGTENGVTFCTRGVSETDHEKQVYANYDEEICAWGQSTRDTWRMVSERPFVLGQFSWSGFDYRGEPQPHEWPSVSSHWGITDTCGFEKDIFYLFSAHWLDRPVLHVFPHWNHEPGEIVRVSAYTNLDSVELIVNGRSLGEKPVTPFDFPIWAVEFEPGLIEAVGRRAGEEVLRDCQRTAGAPKGLVLERMTDPAYEDVLAIGVSLADGEGLFVPTADDLVTFRVKGGEILGVGNGDPNSHEPDCADYRRLFSGRCQLIVRRTAGEKLSLTARTESGVEGSAVY